MPMAKLEIPCIVVHNGGPAPWGPTMDGAIGPESQSEMSVICETPSVHSGGTSRHSHHSHDTASHPISPSETRSTSPGSAGGIRARRDPKSEDFRTTSEETTHAPPLSAKPRTNSKVKLMRSMAISEEPSSPPPDVDLSRPMLPSNSNGSIGNHGSQLSVSRTNPKVKLKHQSSSHGSFEFELNSPSLSRENSTDNYTDSTGIDLREFITETLNRNHKDRILLLKIEQDLISLASEPSPTLNAPARTHHKFSQMSSYQRMLVHRCAAFFGMDHNVDASGVCVVVNKTKNTRIPDMRFRDHLRGDLIPDEPPRRSILKRDSSSFEDGTYKEYECAAFAAVFQSPGRSFRSDARRSKSFEEREEEYERVRKRIFNRDGESHGCHEDESKRSSQEELDWPGDIQPWSSQENELRVRPRRHPKHGGRLIKVESYEGRDTLRANSLRCAMSKSYSFGGYPVSVLTRGDSCASTHSAGPRLLTKQDSGSSTVSSRLSPLSSGYKSLSLRSDTTLSATPSPTATPGSGQPQSSQTPEHRSHAVMWAVTNIDAVPPGSILINPETGQPILNADGSPYRYDPSNPPNINLDLGEEEDELQLAEESAENVENFDALLSPPLPTIQEPIRPATPPQPPQKISVSTTSTSTGPCLTTTATSPAPPVLIEDLPAPPSAPITSVLAHPQTQAGPVPAPVQAVPPPSTQQHMMTYCTLQYPPYQTADAMYCPTATQNPPNGSDLLYMSANHQTSPPNLYRYSTSLDERQMDSSAGCSMPDLSGYMMGMNIMDHRNAAQSLENTFPPQPLLPQHQAPPPLQPPQPHHAAYWPRSQNSYPTYYSNNSSANVSRYMNYPTYPPPVIQGPNQQSMPPSLPADTRIQSNSNYMSGYPVVSYATNDCVQPSMQVVYSPPGTNPAPSAAAGYYPPQNPAQPPLGMPVGPYMSAPTPPQTPTHAQPMCHPFLMMNGPSAPTGPHSAPAYVAQHPHQQTAPQPPPPPPPTQAAAPHYITQPMLPNLGLFRSGVQMMTGVRSSPPPGRPPRGDSNSSGGSTGMNKPPFTRSNSTSAVYGPPTKDPTLGHNGYDAIRFHQPVHMLSLRVVPDMRLVGPLQPQLTAPNSLRLPFMAPPLATGPHDAQALGRPPKPRRQKSRFSLGNSTASNNPKNFQSPESKDMGRYHFRRY